MFIYTDKCNVLHRRSQFVFARGDFRHYPAIFFMKLNLGGDDVG